MQGRPLATVSPWWTPARRSAAPTARWPDASAAGGPKDRTLVRHKALRRQFEAAELKPWRHRAADQRVRAQAARRLPRTRRHHRLRHLPVLDRRPQIDRQRADLQLQRRAAIEMPDFGGINT